MKSKITFNREIKFRVWDNRKGSITYGMNYNAQRKSLEYEYIGYDCYTLMQFTGLLDKNGGEIFEGDIIAHKYKNGFGECCDTGLVKYKAPSFWLDTIKLDKKSKGRVQIDRWMEELGRAEFDLQIIGNIFENPILLK